MKTHVSRLTTLRCAAIAAALLATAAPSIAAQDGNNLRSGAVYTTTDEAANRVRAFYRNPDGTLTPAGSFLTGGNGSGAGSIFGQGSLVLSGREPGARVSGGANHLLLTVNIGSNDISVFRVEPNALVLVDRVPTGGSRPISLSLYQDLLYVVHQGSDDVTGFTVDSRGHLLPIPGSMRALSNSPGANAAQVEFSTDGDELVVTQRGKNGIIDVFLVDKRTGLLSGAIPNSSNSREPFGMAFDNRENLLVAEGNFVIPSAGTVSSYNVLRTGMLQTVSPAVANGGNDTCWIVITNNSRFAYVQSFGDSRISSYTIQPDGTIVLLQSVAGSSGPLFSPGGFDLALNIGSRYLYALNQQGTISAFAVQPDGTLTPLGQVTGLPPSTVGLAAR